MQKDNDLGDDNENGDIDEPIDAGDSVEEPVNRIRLSDIKKRAEERLQRYASEEGVTPEIYEKYQKIKGTDNLEALDEDELEACRRIDRRYAVEAAESMKIMKNFANPLASEMAKISEAMGKNMIKGLEFPKITVPTIKLPSVSASPIYDPRKLSAPEQPQQTSNSGLAQITIPEDSEVAHDEANLQQEIIEKHNTQIELTRTMVDLMAAEAEASKVRADEQKQSSAKMLKWAIAAALIAAVGAITGIATGIIS